MFLHQGSNPCSLSNLMAPLDEGKMLEEGAHALIKGLTRPLDLIYDDGCVPACDVVEPGGLLWWQIDATVTSIA
jgi:hypothetical protein